MRELLPLVACSAALLGLDVVSFPQMMISRPLVGATLAGAFVGDPATGLLVGATLELIALATLPFGASRYPEWGSAAVVGGAIAARAARRAGGHADRRRARRARHRVGRRLDAGEAARCGTRGSRAASARALEPGRAARSSGCSSRGLTSDLVRAMLLTAVAYALLFPVAARDASALWSFDEHALARGRRGRGERSGRRRGLDIFHSRPRRAVVLRRRPR